LVFTHRRIVEVGWSSTSEKSDWVIRRSHRIAVFRIFEETHLERVSASVAVKPIQNMLA